MIRKSFLFVLVCSALAVSAPKVVVTYFMQSFRCYSCEYLEKQTRETVETKFSKEVKAGTVVFRVVQVDQPKNTHFITQYSLQNKSVVVSKMSGKKEVNWKRLDELWDFIDRDAEFSSVVETAVRESLK